MVTILNNNTNNKNKNKNKDNKRAFVSNRRPLSFNNITVLSFYRRFPVSSHCCATVVVVVVIVTVIVIVVVVVVIVTVIVIVVMLCHCHCNNNNYDTNNSHESMTLTVTKLLLFLLLLLLLLLLVVLLVLVSCLSADGIISTLNKWSASFTACFEGLMRIKKGSYKGNKNSNNFVNTKLKQKTQKHE